jgi:pantothenate kinase
MPAAVLSTGELTVRAGSLVTPGRTALLGIAGPPGAGKTTLAGRIAESLGGAVAALVGLDGFHLSGAELVRQGIDARKGAPDTFDRAGFVAALRRLAAGEENVYLPVFDRSIEDSIAAACRVAAGTPLVIVEGNYLLAWPEAAALFDETWYVDPPEAERLAALAARHRAFGKSAEEAHRWAHGSDQRNADLIARGRSAADLLVGWSS